jgi:hypothetical protein
MFGVFGRKKRREFDLQDAFEDFVACVGSPRGTDPVSGKLLDRELQNGIR